MSEFDCQECDDEFDSEKKKLQHELEEHDEELSSHDRDQKKNRLNKLQEKRKSQKRERNRKLKLGAAAGIGVIILGAVGFQAAGVLSKMQPKVNESIGVGTGVHWHADYTIEICGENRVVEDGPMLAHTHGETRFHLEGTRTKKEQATLDWVMEELSTGEFNSTHVFGQSTCKGKPANLTVQVNGKNLENPEEYILRDGDSVLIALEET